MREALDPELAVVDVLWAAPHHDPGLEALLSPDERERAAGFRVAEHRQRFVSAHALLRLALAPRVGMPAETLRFSRTCRTCGGPHGKPEVVTSGIAPHASLSYAGQRVMVAITDTAEIGSDIEEHSAVDFAGFASIALTPEETIELQQVPASGRIAAKAVWWARKEALLKASGHGLVVEPSSIAVSPPSEAPVLLEWNDTDIERPLATMADVQIGAGYAAAVAVIGDHDLLLHVSDAGGLLRVSRSGELTR